MPVGISLESERHQASLSLQDSSQHSARSHHTVWLVSILSLISNSFCSLFKTLGAVPSAPLTSGITVTFLVLWQSQDTCRSFFFFDFYSVIRRDCNISYLQGFFFFFFFFFLLICTRSGWYWVIKISKSKRILCVSFSSVWFGFFV